MDWNAIAVALSAAKGAGILPPYVIHVDGPYTAADLAEAQQRFQEIAELRRGSGPGIRVTSKTGEV